MPSTETPAPFDHEGDSWPEVIQQQLDHVRRSGQWREPMSLEEPGPTHTVAATGEVLVSFASNDYLGLRTHPSVADAAVEAVRTWGTGAGASRLIVGSRPLHHQLEEALADWRGSEAAVLFPTGYAANTGLLSTLAAPGVTVCSDELNHASIIDGCRLAAQRGAEVKVYPHLDLETLDGFLSDAPGLSIVATDTVFSMDGDLADIETLQRLCENHGSLLLLDEAHSVLGPHVPTTTGRNITVRVGTLSKALGALGGFVAAPRMIAELLVNQARSYIFTTAPTPADTAAAHAALAIYRSGEGESLRRRLRELVDRVAPAHPSPILPVLVGNEEAALDASAALRNRGLLVTAIRPPTVPTGTSRLRIAMSAAHQESDVDRLVTALDELGLKIHKGLGT